MDLAAKRIGESKAGIVDEDDQHIGSALAQMMGLRASMMFRLFQRRPRDTGGWDRRKRKDRAIVLARTPST